MKIKFFILLIYLVSTLVDCFAQTCFPIQIIFKTQSQIDAFPINFPGCTQVICNVFISEDISGDVTNLDSLSKIDSIGGSLNIIRNDSLKNLRGLDSLTFIGTSMDISFN